MHLQLVNIMDGIVLCVLLCLIVSVIVQPGVLCESKVAIERN